MLNIKKFLKAIGLVPASSSAIDSKGEIEVLDSSGKINYHNGTTASPVVTESHSATLTNKTINGPDNTITNLNSSNIGTNAAISYTQLSLTDSIKNSDVSSVAAISYTKLNLATSIVNSDVSTTAAIDYSKLNLVDGIKNVDVSSVAAIAYSKLNLAASIQNADISTTAAIAYSKLSLTDTIVNADISSTASIAYSKLNLTDAIQNADVSSVAAIARTKLASGTASHVLINDGSGVMSSEAALDETRGGTGQTTLSTGDLLYASGSNVFSKLSIGSTAQVLTVTAGLPVWENPSSGSGGGLVGSGVASTKSADYTVVSGDNGKLIPVDTAALIVITLPQISSVGTGFNVIVKDTTGTAATNPITVMSYPGDLIDGGDGGDLISGAYQGFVFVSNGTEWKKLIYTSGSASGIRGVFLSGRTGSFAQTTNIEYINSSTLGNGTSFGSMGVATRDRCSNGTINNSTRGVVGGGSNAGGTNLNSIEYITIPTTGNSVSFGTLANTGVCSSLSNSTRGIFCQSVTATSAIDYITIATTGNTTSFGTLATSRDNQAAGVASSTRGVISGGYNGAGPTDSIEYITIASTGNGTSFGTLATARQYHGGFGNLVRGIYVAGLDSGSNDIDNMEYITIATTGNGTSFGSIYSARTGVVGFASSLRGIMAGGIGAANAVVNNIGYVTMATTGNSTSFGTLGTARGGQGVACNFAK